MRGCKWIEEADQLVIQPGLGTIAAPIIAVGTFGCGVFLLAIAAIRDFNEMLLGYLLLNLVLLIASFLWFKISQYPIAIDRQTRNLCHGETATSLATANWVNVKQIPSEDSDAYRIEIVLDLAETVWVGRAGWTEETDPERAEVAARRVAHFLELPLFVGGKEVRVVFEEGPLSAILD